MTLRIRGGLVVTPEGTREGDLLVDGGRILGVEAPGATGGGLDAGGCIVLPGGVDPHTHPLSDIQPATQAALRGGTTTALAFTAPNAGESPADAWTRAHRELLPLAAIDVRLHPSIWEPERLTAADLQALHTLGATSVKLFLAYGELGMAAADETLAETLQTAAGLGLLTMVHCENGDAIDELVREQLAAGQVGVEGFVAARPPAVEQEAVARVLHHAGRLGVPVYLVHLSTGSSVELVREARRRGQTVWAEACTHHLLLDDSCYSREHPERWLEAPPLRPRADVESLWEGVLDGTIDTIGSDHAQVPFRPPFETGDFRSLPYGVAGVEERLPAILSEGRRRGLAWQRLASLLATNAARAFRVDGKGVIAPAAAADLVLWEPGAPWPLTAEALYERADTVFAGIAVDGRIRAVVRGGRVEWSRG